MGHTLVTGGAGFIGSHLVDELIARGEQVTVLDHLSPQVHSRDPGFLNSRARYVFSTIEGAKELPALLKSVDRLYHLAAKVGVGQSMYQPEAYVRDNILATGHLLQTILDHDQSLNRLVVASSMSVYGEGSYRCSSCGIVSPGLRSSERLSRRLWEHVCPGCGEPVTPIPTSEAKPLQPTSVYAITKRDQEELCLSFGRSYGLPTVALRFFNVYGNRQSLSNPYTGVCAIFQSRLQSGQPPIVFEDGAQTRDFVSVHDIVEALILAGEKKAADYLAINIGTGIPVTVTTIARTLMDCYGKNIPLEVRGEYRAGDIRHCYADISRAKETLGFSPRVPLDVGLREFVDWSRTQHAVDDVEKAYREMSSRGLIQGSKSAS